MLWTITKREFLSKLLTLRFTIGFIVCFILIIIDAKVLIRDYEGKLESYSAAVREYENRLSRISIYSELDNEAPPKAFRRPGKLSIFCEGMDKRLGNVAVCALSFVPYQGDILGSENPYLSVFSSIDIMMIFQIVISLLAILFSYDAISGEKESGTLGLSLSQSVPRDKLIIGKYLGGVLSLSLPLLFSLLGAVTLAIVSPYIGFTAGEWLRIGIMIVVSFIYISAFYLLGMLISSKTHRASTSLVISLFLWVLIVPVYPNAVTFIGGQLDPTEDYLRMAQRIDEERASFKKELDVYLEKIGVDQIWDKVEHSGRSVGSDGFGETVKISGIKPGGDESLRFAQDFYDFRQRLLIKYADRIWEMLGGYIERKGKRNVAIINNISRISPAIVYYNAASALSDTDLENYFSFMDQARSYRKEVISYLIGRGAFSSTKWFTDELDKADLSEMPRFTEKERSFSGSLKISLPDITILIILNIMLFMLTYMSFMRYDVR